MFVQVNESLGTGRDDKRKAYTRECAKTAGPGCGGPGWIHVCVCMCVCERATGSRTCRNLLRIACLRSRAPTSKCTRRRLMAWLRFAMGGRPVQTARSRCAAVACMAAVGAAPLAGASRAQTVVRLWGRVAESSCRTCSQRGAWEHPTLLCAMLVSVTVRLGRASGNRRPVIFRL